MKINTLTFNIVRYIISGIVSFAFVWQTIAQDIDSNVPMGWAIVPANGLESTTGGAGGNIVTATTVNQLASYAGSSEPLIILVEGTISGGGKLNITSNKTILGSGAEAKIIGLELSMSGVSNIIIRNLKITGARDGIAARNTHHLWIDHCEVWDCSDGLIDITNESSYATVSWCKFYYESQSDHKLACLIGSGGGDHPEDWDKLKITYKHCWFGNGVDSRMPRIMYGRVHVFNGYYTSSGNGYCIGVGSYGSALIENNYFQNVNDPHLFMYDIYCWIIARGNSYENTTGNKDNGKGGTRDVSMTSAVFPVRGFYTPPYLYDMDNAEDIPGIVTGNAGPHSQFGVAGLMPVPGQGADKLNLDPTLQWTEGQTATSYIVSFGTTNPPSQVFTTTEQFYIPDSLNEGTVYYWKVDQVTSVDTIKGDVWSFRTKGPVPGQPYVSIISPAETDTFPAPADITFETETWDSVGNITSVEYFDGYKPIGIAINEPYSITWENVKAGTYGIRAKVINDLGNAFISEEANFTVVNVVPYVSITSPEYAARFSANSDITITADAADDNGMVTQVEFFNSSLSLGIDDSPPYSVIWEDVAPGKYYISAKVTDNDGLSSKSSLVMIYVDDVSKIDNEDMKHFTLYPNPVSNELVLLLKTNYQGNTYISVHDNLGNSLMKKTVTGNEIILEMSSLSQGVYFITLTGMEGSFVRKIIKK